MRKYIKKEVALLALLIIFSLIYLLNTRIDYRWFYGSFSYAQLNSSNYPKYILRIFTYILAITVSIFVLVLVPSRKLFFTNLGSRTMAVYIFHGFIIKLLVKYNFFDYVNSFISEILIVLLSLLIVILLSSKIINKITKIIVHPKALMQLNKQHSTNNIV